MAKAHWVSLVGISYRCCCCCTGTRGDGGALLAGVGVTLSAELSPPQPTFRGQSQVWSSWLQMADCNETGQRYRGTGHPHRTEKVVQYTANFETE